MKLLISGASGLLGGALVKLATAQGHQCIALDRSQLRLNQVASSGSTLATTFSEVDYFVHAAANTNVEGCEAEPQACYRDNVMLTELLAGAARAHGVPVAFISSTGVYGSHKQEPYLEFDDARPETHHHKSKWQAEQLVLAADWSNLVVRTGWLFGGPVHASKNFVAKRIFEALAAKDGFITSNHEQRGCPTYVVDLATMLLELIAQKARGVFNSVNEGSASRFEYVREIVTQAQLNIEVRPIAAIGFNRVAPVSNNEMAINWRAAELGLPPMRSWQAALGEYIASDNMKQMTP